MCYYLRKNGHFQGQKSSTFVLLKIFLFIPLESREQYLSFDTKFKRIFHGIKFLEGGAMFFERLLRKQVGAPAFIPVPTGEADLQ